MREDHRENESDEERMHALAFQLQLKPFDFLVALLVKNRDPEPTGGLRPCGKANAALRNKPAKSRPLIGRHRRFH